ncbi:MAG: hypothetical protein ACE5I1_11665 [bacterium]
MRKIAHIIKPVLVDETSDLFIAQPVTFESMRRARDFARGQVEVELVSTQYPEDEPFVPADFIVASDLQRSVLDVGSFKKPRKLALIGDIMDRLYEASEAEYFIYTNVDIGLMPHFYTTLNSIIESGNDAFVINRRTVSDKYERPHELPLIYADIGKKHEGHDCFVFRREVYPKYRLGTICIGTAMIGRVFIWNLLCHSQKFHEFKRKHLTFHIGNGRLWQNDEYLDYLEHNKNEAARIKQEMQQEFEPPDDRDPFTIYPFEFNVMKNE